MSSASCHGDVVEDGVGLDAEAARDLDDALGAERALGIDVHHLAVAAAVLDGQLRGDAEGVAEPGRGRVCNMSMIGPQWTI
jgi:hypothetical protein